MVVSRGSSENAEKTVVAIMDEQIVRISDITRKQDRSIADLEERLIEMTVEIKKLSESNGKRTFDGGGSSQARTSTW